MSGIEPSVQQVRERVRIWRRRLIAGAFVFVLLVMAVSQFAVAGRLALQEVAGPIGARLIVGATLCFVAALCALAAWKFPAARAKAEERDKVGSIVDAISLGYALAQDFKAATGLGQGAKGDKHAAKPKENGAAEAPPP